MRGKQTFLIMNGFILNEPIEAWVRFFRHFFQALCISEFFPSEIGQGGCSLIFAPGEDARDQLLKRGISPANILVTGVPRFAGLVEQVLRETERGDISQNHISRGKIRFLYLLGAWDWHANELGMYAEWENIKALDAFAAENRKQFSCVVRVHPRSSQYEISRVKSLDNLNIENLENDLSASLSTTDIAGAIFSTGLLEAIALQKIAVIFDPAHFLPVSAKDTYLEYGMIVVEKMGQFDTLITRLVEAPMSSRDIFQNEVKAFFKFIHPNSIKSAEIIAERIKKELAE